MQLTLRCVPRSRGLGEASNDDDHFDGGFETRSKVCQQACQLGSEDMGITWTSFSLRSTSETMAALSPLSGLEFLR